MFDAGRHGDDTAGDNVFAAVLPPYPDKTIVEFYIEASDGELIRTWPAASDDSGSQSANAHYLVTAASAPGIHDSIHVVMTPDDDRVFREINRSSSAFMNATTIWQRGEDFDIRYQCGVRIRGNSSRRSTPHPIRLSVPQDDPIGGRTEFNINSNNPYLQIFGMQIFRKAAIAAPEARPVRLTYNGANRARTGSPMFGHYVLMEPLGDEFLRAHFPDSGGNLYKKRSANPSRDRKRWGVHFETNVAYTKPNWYRTDRWEKQTNVGDDDWSDLQRFVEVMHAEPDETFFTEIDNIVNREQWLRWFAVMTILNNKETNLSNGIDDDYSMYRGLEDPRFVLLPHDLDSIFNGGAAAGESIFPMIEEVAGVRGTDFVPQLNRYMRNPEIRSQYFAQMEQLLATIFEPSRFNRNVDQVLGTWVPETTRSAIKKSLKARRDFVLNRIAPMSPVADWMGERTGDLATTSDHSISLSGTYDPRTQSIITVAGTEAELDPTARTWSISAVELLPGINRIAIVGRASDDSYADSSWIDVWRTGDAGAVLAGEITEDSTLIAEDGPYVVTGNTVVATNVTLSVEPGTNLFFNPGARLTVRGILKAEGTAERRIRFCGIPGSELVADIRDALPLTPPKWAGVVFENTLSSENILSHIDFENGQDTNGTVRVANSEVLIDSCTFIGSRLRYIYATSSSVTVSHCLFPDMFLAGEKPHELKLDNISEHIKSTGAYPVGGHFIIRGNTFGTNAGHNDVIDVDSGKRSDTSRGILQVIDNVFSGARDELLDLGGDAYIAGNLFRNVYKDDLTSDRGYANAISTGDGLVGGTIVAVRNVFWDLDHAINLRRDVASVFEHNTVVNIHDDFVDNFGFTNVGSAINLFVEEPGATPALGAYAAGNIFHQVPRVFGNADLPSERVSNLALDNNLVSRAASEAKIGQREASLFSLGNGNVTSDIPRFFDAESGDFRLQADSPAVGKGMLGNDAGAFAASGIFISGTPEAVTNSTTAQLAFGGPGIFSFQYKINDGEWSEEIVIGPFVGFNPVDPPARTATVELTDLAAGNYQVAARGRDFAGNWQSLPTLSPAWEVREFIASEQIRISEILASNDAAHAINELFPDLIELENRGNTALNLGSWTLSDNPDMPTKFTFPQGTTIAPGEFLVVAAGTNVGDAMLSTEFGLNSKGDALYLYDDDGALIDSVEFGFQITDRSIARVSGEWCLANPTLGTSNEIAASVGAGEMRINEWLPSARTRFAEDFLELFNAGSLPARLDGTILSDDLTFDPHKFSFPFLSFLDSRSFLVLEQNDLNFGLSREAEVLSLLNQAGDVIDEISILNAAADTSYGRLPDGSNTTVQLALQSPGAPNIFLPDDQLIALLNQLRVTELLSQPGGDSEHEFIELQNLGTTALDLTGVRFTEGINFTFDNLSLEPGAYVVVAQNADAFKARYGIGVTIAGEYSGQIDNSGETIELQLPAPFDVPIQRFRYEGDWFAEMASGTPIEFVADPMSPLATWNDRASWLPSTNPLGSPGSAGAAVIFPQAAALFSGEEVDIPVVAGNEVTTFRASGLPSGLVLDRDTGRIRGVATEHGSFDVTITANNRFGQRRGTLTLYVDAHGPFDRLVWGEISPHYQAPSDSIPLQLQAQDSSGRLVEDFSSSVTLSATSLGPPTALVIFTEVLDSNGANGFELVNVSGRPLPTAGWKIAFNDPNKGISAAHTEVFSLPDVMDAAAIIAVDDLALPWTAKSGWILLSDGNGNVVDFVAWGLSANDISNLSIDVNGIGHEPGLHWKGASIEIPEGESLHRVGMDAKMNAAQWQSRVSSLGDVESLAIPFATTLPYELPFPATPTFDTGTWSRDFVSALPLYGLQIAASHSSGHTTLGPVSFVSSEPPTLLPEERRISAEGQPFFYFPQTRLGEEPMVYSAKDLPSGWILDPIMGTITGTVPSPGAYQFSLIGKNLAGETAIVMELTSLMDTDGDGAPDAWETANGFNPNVADAHLDADRDGVSNRREFYAATDPNDSTSVFRIIGVRGHQESGITLNWTTVAGRRYRVEFSSDLKRWHPLTNGTLIADGEALEFTFPLPPDGPHHYLVRLLP